MAVQFEFYKNPVQGEEEGETSYHPRVVNFQHVTTQRLAVEIHSATTFGKAEVEAMLMELSRCMGNHLREGQRVHLDGVGYFQITLQATEPIHSMAAHADKVKFKSVSFLADRYFAIILAAGAVITVPSPSENVCRPSRYPNRYLFGHGHNRNNRIE